MIVDPFAQYVGRAVKVVIVSPLDGSESIHGGTWLARYNSDDDAVQRFRLERRRKKAIARISRNCPGKVTA